MLEYSISKQELNRMFEEIKFQLNKFRNKYLKIILLFIRKNIQLIYLIFIKQIYLNYEYVSRVI